MMQKAKPKPVFHSRGLRIYFRVKLWSRKNTLSIIDWTACFSSGVLEHTLGGPRFCRPAGADASVADFKAKKKKKSVRFGGPLSPEFFDRHLPPSTPLQKGGTPARAPTPGGALRSALKTPQRSNDGAAAAHPDLDVLSAFGASPVLKMPRNRRMASVGEDEDGQVRRRVVALAVMCCTCSVVPAGS